jgi:hypothetical protein
MSDKEPTAPVTLEFLLAQFANSAIYHNEGEVNLLAQFANSAIYHNEGEVNAARAEITRIYHMSDDSVSRHYEYDATQNSTGTWMTQYRA